VINLSSSTDIKLYKSITTLFKNKFDGKVTNLLPFMDNLHQKASRYGWNQTLLMISDQHATNPSSKTSCRATAC
jgi:hypothetical protein